MSRPRCVRSQAAGAARSSLLRHLSEELASSSLPCHLSEELASSSLPRHLPEELYQRSLGVAVFGHNGGRQVGCGLEPEQPCCARLRQHTRARSGSTVRGSIQPSTRPQNLPPRQATHSHKTCCPNRPCPDKPHAHTQYAPQAGHAPTQNVPTRVATLAELDARLRCQGRQGCRSNCQ